MTSSHAPWWERWYLWMVAVVVVFVVCIFWDEIKEPEGD